MFKKITDILKDHRGDDTLEITEATSFSELGMDSLEMVELLMDMEDEFSVTLEPNPALKTVGDLAKAIEEQKQSERIV